MCDELALGLCILAGLRLALFSLYVGGPRFFAYQIQHVRNG